MTTARFEKTIEIGAAPARVHAELVDPQRQLGLQPLLVEVTPLPAQPGDDPQDRRFTAVEKVPLFAGIQVPNRIRVTLRPGPQHVDFHARAVGGIEVRSRFELEGFPGGTRVRERVAVRLPWLLRRFVLPRAIDAQTRLLANLKHRLEA